MKVEKVTFGEEKYTGYGVKLIAETVEDSDILERFDKGGIKINAYGTRKWLEPTFPDLVEPKSDNWYKEVCIVVNKVWKDKPTSQVSRAMREALARCALDICHETGDPESWYEFCADTVKEFLKEIQVSSQHSVEATIECNFLKKVKNERFCMSKYGFDLYNSERHCDGKNCIFQWMLNMR